MDIAFDKLRYLNNSATSFPKPSEVAAAVQKAMLNPPEMTGRGEETGAKDKVRSAREHLARFFGCPDPTRFIFTSNSTDAINLAIHGLVDRFQAEGLFHAVTTTNDHNAVLRPLRTLEAAGLVELSIVPSDGKGILDTERIISALRPETHLLAVNHLSNVTGVISPIDVLGAHCREKGIPFLVDASQSGGILDIHVEKMNIDLLAITGHKYMLGPTGIGALYITEGLELLPRKQGGTGVRSEYPFQPEELPIRFEAGTVNYHGAVGLDAACSFIEERGLTNIRSRIVELRSRCEQGLRSLGGVTVYGPDADVDKGPVVSFTVKNHRVEEVAGILREQYRIITRPGLHCAPLCHKAIGTGEEGAIRASFSFLSEDDGPAALIEAVRQIASC